MDIAGKIKNFLNPQAKVNNTMAPTFDGNDFLRKGNRSVQFQDWSQVSMTDLEFYSGYSYAAINNRANKVAQLAIDSIKTDATEKLRNQARKSKSDIIHPYLTLIDESDDFTNTQFWYDISTYLDLEGVYYLMAVRTVAPKLVGKVQYFKMLNPYEIRRVRNKETMEIGGYIETREGLTREIPKEMIIEIRKLNPFSRDSNFAMTDAAKESQFTIKQAADFTRSSLKNNLSSPGIISTDVILEPETFRNFQARVVSQEKGTPLFANGTGGITWNPMQIEIDKAALMDINEINRSTLFAVSGVSKTTMGIEESGTTRDVARTQKEKFIEDHIMPQLQLIIDALNQDYKRYYKDDYALNKYNLFLDNPLGVDKDSEVTDITIAQTAYDLYMSLVNAGYDSSIAAKYAQGETTLEDLGEPTNEPKQVAPPIILGPDGNPIAPVDATTPPADTTPTKPKKTTPPATATPDTKAAKDQTVGQPKATKASPKDKATKKSTTAAVKKNRLEYLQKNGIEEFIIKYDGKLTSEELSEYLDLE